MATMSFNPQTPQSPSQFSPSAVDPLSSMNTSMTSMTTALPTPAHSVNESTHADIVMSDADSPQKRKRLPDDMGSQEQKKVHLEDPRRLGIENLHQDVGEKYLVCRTPHSVSVPLMSADLFEMFDLTGIAAEVARVRPNGEKNALRKTYKGHMKTLGIVGHFDSVKKEDRDPTGLLAMTSMPEDVWQVHQVIGKDIQRGFSDQVQSSLLRATTMAKGPVVKAVWDSSVLGDLAPTAAKKPKEDASKLSTPGTPIGSSGGAVKSNKLQVPHVDRARRNVKKRSYQDSSFEGYGEGFPDDDTGAGSGYSTGEGDDRSSKQKRRKQNPGSGSFGSVRQQSYSGVVGT